MTPPATMIEVHAVSKSFGRFAAVRDLHFQIPRGQVVGLLGSNGAGKTTTIRMITGFIPPDLGDIRVGGHHTIDDSINARRQVGYLPESAPAHPEMTVTDHLRFRATMFHVPRRTQAAAIDRVVGLCELAEVRHRRVGQLSKGYRQRVGLAAALVHDPPVVILDEPANALDPRQIRHTRDIIRELGQTKAVLVSSHILPEVEHTCDRLILLAHGRIRADGSPREIIERHADAFYLVEARARGVAPADRDAIIGRLRQISGVAEVHELPSDPPHIVFKVHATRGSNDLRESLASACDAAGLLVRELTRQRPTLERAFVQLVEQDQERPS